MARPQAEFLRWRPTDTTIPTAGAIGITQIPTTLTNISSGSIQGVEVTGTVTMGLQLTRTIEFNNSNWSASGGWVTFNIQLTNTGSSTFSNVAYLENDDPDNDYDVYGRYDTVNDLVDGGDLLLATGPVSSLTMGLGSVNSTSVLGDPGLYEVQNPFQIIGNANDNPEDTDSDTTINQAFNFGSLAPGQTAMRTYQMVFGTSAAEAETLFGNSTGALNVTNATTGEDVQTTSGLVITPYAADAGTVTSFQITNITGGSLFLNDGVTPVTNGEFISVAQGAAGLKFTPTTGSLATGSFAAEESTTGDTSGLIAASTAKLRDDHGCSPPRAHRHQRHDRRERAILIGPGDHARPGRDLIDYGLSNPRGDYGRRHCFSTTASHRSRTAGSSPWRKARRA